MKKGPNYFSTLAAHKREALLIVLPLLFVVWVVVVMVKVNRLQTDVANKVGAISYLNDVREDFNDLMVENTPGERAARKVHLINGLNAQRELLSDSLYISIEQIYFGNKSSQFDYLEVLMFKEIRQLRAGLGRNSIQLSGLWNQAAFIGIIACLFAVVSASLFIRNLGVRKKLTLVNANLNQLNAELREKGLELGEMNETKDRLFAIIGHDLRSPINSLKALFDLLDQNMISQDQFKHYASKLRNNVEHVHFSLNNLLLWAHAQMQGIKTHARPVTIAPLVEEVQHLLQEFASKKGVHVSIEVEKGQQAFVDPDHLKLIFRNLISNAIKFTPRGGSVRILGSTLNNAPLFSVVDTGNGMSETTLKSLFKKQSFKPLPGTDGEKGSGLGLVLCHDFVKKNDGAIWAESTLDNGSTFHFSLPAA